MKTTYRKVFPNHFDLPKRIERLGELAYIFWWSWNPEAERLYRLIDKELWEEVYHSPIQFLKQVARSRLNAVTQDRYYLTRFDKIFDGCGHPHNLGFR